MRHIDISPDEAAALAYALTRHVRNLDRLLGKNAQWPRERRGMVSLFARLRRHALSDIEDIDGCLEVYRDDRDFF